jgi:hypothetical protein
MDLQAEPMPEQVSKFCVLRPGERFHTRQELVVSPWREWYFGM